MDVSSYDFCVKYNISAYETLEKLNWSPEEFVNITKEKGSDLNTGTAVQPATRYPFLKSGKRQAGTWSQQRKQCSYLYE